MNAFAKSGCGCGCSPCTCGTSPDTCNDFCVPRPCFFPGQLVTADDLNAVMDYVRARERMFAKLAFGWGILGGMRLLSGGKKSMQFLFDTDPPLDLPVNLMGAFPNPQVIAGSTIQVSAGAAFDSMGRSLSLCGPRSVDLALLSKGLGVTQAAKSCTDWFGADFCERVTLGPITGAVYWVIAEYTETPTRPVPGLAGGGACDPEPFCDFTRKLEGVRIRLVPDLPTLFFMHGCLEDPDIPGLQAFIEFVFDNTNGEGGGGGGGGEAEVPPPPTGANDTIRNQFACLGFKVIPNYYEYLSQVAFETCCAHPAIALGRVLLATEVDSTVRAALGDAPYYTFIDDAFPYRRVVSNVANTHLIRREIPEAVQMCGDLPPIPPPAE